MTTSSSGSRPVLPLALLLGLAFAGATSGQLPLAIEFVVSEPSPGDEDSPAIGMRDDGRFTVVWRDGPAGDTSDILRRNFDADGVPFAAAPLSEAANASQVDPAMAMNGNGDWIAGWVSDQVAATQPDLIGRRTTTNGSILLSESQINATGAHDTERVQLACSEDDSYVAVWKDGADGNEVYFRRFSAAGSPVTGDTVANQAGVSPPGGLDVAALPDGGFVIVWVGSDADGLGVYARCFDDTGVPAGNEFRVNVLEADDQEAPSVAADRRGEFVVTWRDSGVGTPLEFRRFGPDCAPLSDELRLSTIETGTRVGPRLDMAPDGAFVVTWGGTSQDSDLGISVREFTRSGRPVGDEFLAHNNLPGRQVDSGVGIGDRVFVVVWADQEGTSGTVDTIIGSRYLRRVVFSDDFESADLFYWSVTAP